MSLYVWSPKTGGLLQLQSLKAGFTAQFKLIQEITNEQKFNRLFTLITSMKTWKEKAALINDKYNTNIHMNMYYK